MASTLDLLYEGPSVKVAKDTTKWETYKVWVDGKRVKTFKGESAWCDAERYACDHDQRAMFCTS